MASAGLGGSDGEFTFLMLGALQLRGRGDVVDLSGRPALMLASLLVHANRTIGLDDLVEAIWGDRPPASSRAQMSYCVHSLRLKFEELELPAKIITQAPGYRLEVDPRRIDSSVFHDLVMSARDLLEEGHLADSSEILRNGLFLWRGPVLDGIPNRVRDQVGWLEELRIEAQEEYLGIELDLGRHREVVGELQTLVSQLPLVERFRHLLMTALYRCGRQAEALDVFERGRNLIAEQLGLDPSERLTALESAIREGDTAALQASLTRQATARADNWPEPRQLPAAIGDFIGREQAVAEVEDVLVRSLAHSVPVVNVYGKAGVGKSALAVHVAHRLAATQFADGQLYVSLSRPDGEQVTAHVVLGQFLRALGVGGDALPTTEAERAMLYRSLLAGRRVLVLVEDVVDETRLASLVPGSPGCALIATSRIPLAGAAGVRLVQLDVFPSMYGLALLSNLIGENRVVNEIDAARELVEAVGRLPLALRIVGARLAARPHWPLARLAERLTDDKSKLDELAHGGMVVRGSLELSYAGLGEDAAKLLRRLSTLQSDTIPSWIVGALMNDAGHGAFDQMDRLVDAQLVDVVAADSGAALRYRFHDLVRLFARERAESEKEDRGHAPLRRVLGGWLALAEQAHRGLYGGDFITLRGNAPRWAHLHAPMQEVEEDPMRWLEAERTTICRAIAQGADAGLDEVCWDLAVTMVSLFEVRGHYDDWLSTHEDALKATRDVGNERGSAALMCSLGSLHLSRGWIDAAREVLSPARIVFEHMEDHAGLALVHRNFGMLEYLRGEHRAARRHLTRAFREFELTSDPVGQAAALALEAQIDIDTADHVQARRLLERAAGICADTPSRRVRAQLKHQLGKVLLAEGEHHPAAEVFAEMLDLVRADSDVRGVGIALQMLGVTETRLGRHPQAADYFTEALDHCARVFDGVSAAWVELDIAELEVLRGRFEIAARLRKRAEAVLAERGLVSVGGPRWADGLPARKVYENTTATAGT